MHRSGRQNGMRRVWKRECYDAVLDGVRQLGIVAHKENRSRENWHCWRPGPAS